MIIESIIEGILSLVSFGHLPSDIVEIITYFSSVASEVNQWINLSELLDTALIWIGLNVSIIGFRLLLELL